MATPPKPSNAKGSFPNWLVPAGLGVGAIALLTFMVFKAVESVGMPFPLIMTAYFTFGVLSGVLCLAGVVYVFRWMQDVRKLLRTIAASNRSEPLPAPHWPEPQREPRQSSWPEPPKPLIPDEDRKYLPKG